MAAGGPIPACAGQPIEHTTRLWPKWAYPRVCGATITCMCMSPSTRGLSPRVRGNPKPCAERHGCGGPIPACAGQPPRADRSPSPNRAYPRVCGATDRSCCSEAVRGGLSPRVRGNRRPSFIGPPGTGPIPACAGQPVVALYARITDKAYPRVCGATVWPDTHICSTYGLSPRVRGNLRAQLGADLLLGPIPACAGQPITIHFSTGSPRAYPRVCGATCRCHARSQAAEGLSPRVRGNLGVTLSHDVPKWPIPACAGQPGFELLSEPATRAYPRVCGATEQTEDDSARDQGLSPRVRGNQVNLLEVPASLGPIPACAGQPTPRPTASGGDGAYPRVCGATSCT